MNKLRNIWIIFSSLVIIAIALMVAFTYFGPYIVLVVLTVTVVIYAISQLRLYFGMARFMVGGKNILFKGVIAMDFAIFLISINDFKPMYMMVYFIVIYFVTGVIDLFRALEIKKMKDGAWKRKAIWGLINVIISIICLIFIQSYEVVCYIYAFGLILTAIGRISGIFRKTTMVYIQ